MYLLQLGCYPVAVDYPIAVGYPVAVECFNYLGSMIAMMQDGHVKLNADCHGRNSIQ